MNHKDRAAIGPFSFRSDKLYLAFNKPFGVLSQFTQPQGSESADKPTLADYSFPPSVYPVGRLDHDSEGLLLLSDDPRFNEPLLNPSRRHPRSYLVQVEHIPTAEGLQMLREGVIVQGKKTLPASVQLLAGEPDIFPRPVPIRVRRSIPTAWLQLALTEGRNRQVRRMTAAIGCPTLRLIRIAIGGFHLSEAGLAPGEWRTLRREEVARIFQHPLREGRSGSM